MRPNLKLLRRELPKTDGLRGNRLATREGVLVPYPKPAQYRFLSVAAACALSILIYPAAAEQTQDALVVRQGGLAILDTQLQDPRSATLADVTLPLTNLGLVVVPIHMDTEPRRHSVTVIRADGSETPLAH